MVGVTVTRKGLEKVLSVDQVTGFSVYETEGAHQKRPAGTMASINSLPASSRNNLGAFQLLNFYAFESKTQKVV